MEEPEKLYEKSAELVKDGWFRNEKNIFADAIRRFLDSRWPELMEKYILHDVNWSLHGQD